MNIVMILILASLCVAAAFLGFFIWAVRSGQYEDTLTPSMRVLMDDEKTGNNRSRAGKENSDGAKNNQNKN